MDEIKKDVKYFFGEEQIIQGIESCANLKDLILWIYPYIMAGLPLSINYDKLLASYELPINDLDPVGRILEAAVHKLTQLNPKYSLDTAKTIIFSELDKHQGVINN